jgi:hypothetical protein
VESEYQIVGRVLRDYAERGVFRSVSEGEMRLRKMTFVVLWHHRRRFRIVVDTSTQCISFPSLLPSVESRSPLMKQLRAFLHEFKTDAVPAHRRVDPAKADLYLVLRRGDVSLGLSVRAGEVEYCTRRLVHLAHEVFMVFLPDGPYDSYRVEHLGLDPNLAYA